MAPIPIPTPTPLPGPPRAHCFEDSRPGVTCVSPARTVSQADAVAFAQACDPRYFHTDPVRARDSAVGELVCGGFQTAALAWALALDPRLFDQCPIAGLGVDELRWRLAVQPGDTLRCRFALPDARDPGRKADRGVERSRFGVVNPHGRVATTPVLTQLLRKRPADAG